MNNILTQESINLIKTFEGKRLVAYKDSVGIWTIGYGHIKGVYEGMKITEQGASQFLIEDLAIATACVNRVIKKPMTDYEFGAFVSLTHNIGIGAFAKSTTARRFNKGDKNGAANGILMWNKITVDMKKVFSQGLADRRRAEVTYFYTGIALTDDAFKYETTAGEGGEKPSAASAWGALTVLAATIALFWDKVEAAFVGILNGFI